MRGKQPLRAGLPAAPSEPRACAVAARCRTPGPHAVAVERHREIAGRNGIHLKLKRRPIGAHASCKVPHRSFRRRVSGDRRPGELTLDAGDVDDLAASTRNHVPRHSLTDIEARQSRDRRKAVLQLPKCTRQITPRTTRAGDPQHRLHKQPVVRPAAAGIRRLVQAMRFHHRPLGVGQNQTIHPQLESHPRRYVNPHTP